MENQEVKKKLGRTKNIHTPIKHFTEEERKRAITRSKTKYMVNKERSCDVCAGDNYTLAGKTKHLKKIKQITSKRILYKKRLT